ncbi:FMN-binding glutamate synthase family protein [Zhaonella formicivorans]|uniref:FMN-binding glutamate synthase family protein n=1 Tax=Zhaonella formicivorans TaxID=2528593 RepID=UPI0010EF51E0|nr:FMN-binding glutamate synthase family protein [Zhaonella formicivorans]
MLGFFGSLLTGFSTIALAGIGTFLFGKQGIDYLIDNLSKSLVTDKYPENLWEMYNTAQKVTPGAAMEAAMRAETGKALNRPYGSPLHFSPWEKLLFNPVQLFRLPVPDNVSIETRVVIGPRARNPLKLAIPLLIGGMSYGGALSKRAKIALAIGASMAGSATNSGESGFLPEERKAANRFILQYHRGGWTSQAKFLNQADMIEIQLGQGAQASAPMKTPGKLIGEEMREAFQLLPGQDAVIHSRLPQVEEPADLKKLVEKLRKISGGVPIGIKLAASHHLEKELLIAIEAGVDVIALDGAEGGTHGGPPILQDDVGLPTMLALVRADEFLKKYGIRQDISLIAAGGLRTPGQFLKAMALGADAVYIGTIATIAMVSDQAVKALPWEPPTSLLFYLGPLKEELDVDRAGENLANFLRSAVHEMTLVARTLGKTSLKNIDKSDLCALDQEVARFTGVALAYHAPDEVFPFVPLGSGDTRYNNTHY